MSDQWLTDVAQLVEPEIREYLDLDTGAYAAGCYPDADAFHLRVCAEFFNWTFVIDDRMEYSVVDARETHESCILAFRDPINFDTEQFAAKMSKSYDYFFIAYTLSKTALRRLLAPAAQSEFIRGSELFFAAVAKQVDDRAKGNMYDLESYIVQRRNVVALKPCFALIEFVAQIDLPDEVVSHPIIMALEDATNDHISWSNDIFSYNKEQSRGDAHWHNIVAVLMHDRGLDLQGAMDYAGQMCKDAIQRFETNRAILPSWEEEVDRQVAVYVEGLQNWIVGSLHWHLNSPAMLSRRTRIIRLLPRRSL
ncbi:isoprenoid synthase domain-containing protein [Suillus subalutaceus]|uniref:isoprenoid synthase domain-containing protein n=1 Tax=Suillus subalutaceus TaxID=48586 RepID=UPI001B860A4E|nr:isoprenoid synthase domain-containing protein [Suillus subalutaceus]KAG1852809.1 isoprenoid synthase domain-containing protein [Suillus subalutaceus]